MRKSNKNEFNKKLKNKNRTVRLIGEYINSDEKTLFTDICNHIWEAIPYNILKGSGCPFCAPNLKSNHQEFLLYLYENNIPIKPLEEYITANKQIKCQCLICDHIWPISPNKIKQKRGCPNCANKKKKLSKEQQEKKKIEINQILKNRNIILTGDYINARTSTEFYNTNCKHYFNNTPDKVLHGQDCSICNTGGFNPNKPAILYYIKLIEYDLYKIGITNNTVNKRFKDELHKIEIIFTKKYKLGKDAKNKEQEILKQFSNYKYIGQPILESGGNTEIFTKNIIEDIISIINTS